MGEMPLTPFELKLRHDLEIEFRRMDHDWFFQWYNLNIRGHVVDVDSFDGKRIHTGGAVFGDTVQQNYWEAVERYLRQKTHETFVNWKIETEQYPAKGQASSLEGTVALLRKFAARIIEKGVETDRRLRGRGFPKQVPEFNASRFHTAANAEIERLKTAHLGLIAEPDKETGIAQRAEDFLSTRHGIISALVLLVAILSVVVALIAL